MYRIKRVSAAILREKTQDTTVAVSDMNTKRDIMSLLVRARKADLDKDKGVYAMSDRAMMDQVVSYPIKKALRRSQRILTYVVISS
jgi:hypothetical protein